MTVWKSQINHYCEKNPIHWHFKWSYYASPSSLSSICKVLTVKFYIKDV